MPFFLRQIHLGRWDNMDCFIAEINDEISLPNEVIILPLRKALDSLGSHWTTILAKAHAILNWDKNHQHCGQCGTLTVYKQSYERICEICHLSFFPRLSPSVIILIKRNDEILLSRSPHFRPGIYGLIAGYVEAGENIEETIHREIKEEVNIRIKNLHYFGSQYWPFPDSLMIGFFADYADGELKIDQEEIEAADWYRYDHLPGLPQSNSIAKKMIDHFVMKQTLLNNERNNP